MQFNAQRVEDVAHEGEPALGGATALLVSSFIEQQEEKFEFFKSIASLLTPGSPLVVADYIQPQNPAAYADMINFWESRWAIEDSPLPELPVADEILGKVLHPITEARFLTVLTRAGFRQHRRIFSSLLVSAWVTELC
ncbi:MAG: hypothetical protein AAFY15_13470 [Cyanobacteria bacterium J06648_11]